MAISSIRCIIENICKSEHRDMFHKEGPNERQHKFTSKKINNKHHTCRRKKDKKKHTNALSTGEKRNRAGQRSIP